MLVEQRYIIVLRTLVYLARINYSYDHVMVGMKTKIIKNDCNVFKYNSRPT